MLIDTLEVGAADRDPIYQIIGHGARSKHLMTGVYEIGHFGSSEFLKYGYYTWRDENRNPPLPISEYGVCDNFFQILAKAPQIFEDPLRQFVITVTPIFRVEQSSEGGWRWHKWGEYIGTQEPKYEYLYDEKDIDKVYVYHIYERKL